jgi:(p)ppGpp synthase/HD superfamily hydrolase
MLTKRYDEAFRYAHERHDTQTRKGTSVPYISHLMIVSALVVENGGSEDQAIGALLHDAAEDQGGAKTLDEIRNRFGDTVAEIVSGCTDSWDEPKPEWRPRKEAYLAKLAAKPPRSLLVSLADKTHNAEAILYDYRVLADALWDRFNGGAMGTRWYYRSLAEIFSEVMPGPLSDRLSRAAAAFSERTTEKAEKTGKTEKPEPDPEYLAQLLADHPGLTREKALRMIKESGG